MLGYVPFEVGRDIQALGQFIAELCPVEIDRLAGDCIVPICRVADELEIVPDKGLGKSEFRRETHFNLGLNALMHRSGRVHSAKRYALGVVQIQKHISQPRVVERHIPRQQA